MVENAIGPQSINDTLEEFCSVHDLYLKPIFKVNITVQIPGLHSAGFQSKSLSTWEIADKLRQLCPSLLSPPTQLKVSRATVEFVRFVVELNSKADVKKVVKSVDSQRIKLSGFPQALRVRGAEALVDCPRKYDWDAFFRDATDMDETRPGERPDTLVVRNFPIRWFASDQKDSNQKTDFPSIHIVKQVFQKFGSIRRIDIPMLDPCQNRTLLTNLDLPRRVVDSLLEDAESDVTVSSSGAGEVEGSFGKITPPTLGSSGFGLQSTVEGTSTSTLTFTAFIQYTDYSGFTTAMEALRGMKLVYAPKRSTLLERLNTSLSPPALFSAEIQVDFDRSKHLSDESLSRRRSFRQRIDAEVEREKARQRRLTREAEEAAEKLRLEKEKMVQAQQRAKAAEREAHELARQQRKRLRAEETYTAKRDALIRQKLLLEDRRAVIANRRAAAIRILSAVLHQVYRRQQETVRLQNLEAKRPKLVEVACQAATSRHRIASPIDKYSETNGGFTKIRSSSKSSTSSRTVLPDDQLRKHLLVKRELQLRQRLLERHRTMAVGDFSHEENF